MIRIVSQVEYRKSSVRQWAEVRNGPKLARTASRLANRAHGLAVLADRHELHVGHGKRVQKIKRAVACELGRANVAEKKIGRADTVHFLELRSQRPVLAGQAEPLLASYRPEASHPSPSPAARYPSSRKYGTAPKSNVPYPSRLGSTWMVGVAPHSDSRVRRRLRIMIPIARW